MSNPLKSASKTSFVISPSWKLEDRRINWNVRNCQQLTPCCLRAGFHLEWFVSGRSTMLWNRSRVVFHRVRCYNDYSLVDASRIIKTVSAHKSRARNPVRFLEECHRRGLIFHTRAHMKNRSTKICDINGNIFKLENPAFNLPAEIARPLFRAEFINVIRYTLFEKKGYKIFR